MFCMQRQAAGQQAMSKHTALMAMTQGCRWTSLQQPGRLMIVAAHLLEQLLLQVKQQASGSWDVPEQCCR
jgi:hypothetical protein